MSVQEPAWLKKTRPCPFFSQGRCLFADACNFLHDVKVRSAVTQPLRSTVQVKQLHHHPKPVFHPPFVVVDSASPRPVPQSPTSLARGSSRYSGLLSVLSDVIGPPSDPPTTPEATSSTPQDTTYARTDAPSEHEPTNTIVNGAEQDAPSRPEATLVDSLGKSSVPEADGDLVSESHPVSHNEEFGDEDATPYVMEGTYVIASGGEEDAEDEDMNDRDDPTVMLSNRQSVLSSFTGASLLASPQHSVFGDNPVASPIGDGTVDLLSPVQLSAKLRLFPALPLYPKGERGDSIDSGYADGDSWVSPLPFPRSPPRSLRSSVAFSSYSRRGSLSSPASKERRVSYNVGPLCKPVEVIKEVESDGNLEDNEDAVFAILDAYDALPSEEHGDLVQAHVAEEKAEEDKPSAVRRSPLHTVQVYWRR